MLAAAAQKACENRKHITLRPARHGKLVQVGTRTVVVGARLHFTAKMYLTYIIALHRYARIVHASTPTPLCDG